VEDAMLFAEHADFNTNDGMRSSKLIECSRDKRRVGSSMDWYDICTKAHRRTFPHDCQLSSLSTEWERELAALWRLEADVNNGAYLQFLSNWGRESYVYASQALKKIGANKMAAIIDSCQALVDEHFNCDGASQDQMQNLMPNPAMDGHGNLTKEAGSILPDSVVTRIYDLSYEFMNYPDDIPEMGMRYYTRPKSPRLRGGLMNPKTT
jgi:hypothetical protein